MKNLIAAILSIILYPGVNLYLLVFARDVSPCSLEDVKGELLNMFIGEPGPEQDDAGYDSEDEQTLVFGCRVLWQEYQDGKIKDEELAKKITGLIKGGSING